METIARAFPIKSKAALEEMAITLDAKFSSKDKKILADEFGLDCELWFYQEIERKPYVVAVVRGETLDQGFKKWANTENPFAKWFRGQVLELTGHDLSIEPKGPSSDLVYELRA